jgi:DNA modification methylase
MKLTKEDIDKVRHIEGFPIAKDEDIIALSNPPYYTACPNPFIEDFIKEHGKPYDEATDDYHREPFAADVSEGKNDPIYMAHGYHTKVPHKAIMRYILHYTNPGDIILDSFCGTGMTAVAALACGNATHELKLELENELKNPKMGSRKAIVSDLSPIATFIASNYINKLNMQEFCQIIEPIIDSVEKELGWVYETKVPVDIQKSFLGETFGNINYTVWSDVYICKSCSSEFVYWDCAVDKDAFREHKDKKCPNCGALITTRDMEKAYEHIFDKITCEVSKRVKQVPVMIKYSVGTTQYKKSPDQYDLDTIAKIKEMENRSWYPTNIIPNGDKTSEPLRISIDRVYKIYTDRNLLVLSSLYEAFDRIENKRIRNFAKFLFSSVYSRSHKMNRYMPDYNRHVGPLAGTLYFPFFSAEINIFNLVRDKLTAIKRIGNILENAYVSTQSATDLQNIPDNSIDYIFTDPPFGDNIMYSELNYANECWNKVLTNNSSEAIINKIQEKGIVQYQSLMCQSFKENFRVLKPGRWMTVVFHNSKNSVWNCIQEAINIAGFIIADVRTLDKQKGTTNQLSYGYAVKQDLVISAYKPKDSFKRDFISHAGSEETAWSFVRQHLENLPVVVVKNGKIELIAERQAFLLYDRMVAYHIMNGIAVPLDATDFYKGLDERFLKRDGMYFLADQVNEYDTARIVNDVEPIQFELFVTNEKSAIAWLYQQLETPQTYAELQPKFMQEIKAWDKFEVRPELAVLLEENFLQDDKGRWYIPDITKSGDVAKLREKKLLKEFEGYLATKGKLKLFRTEAIRVGFAKLWADKNYKLIVETAERLPESVIQEDDKLLMYYDISLGRI